MTQTRFFCLYSLYHTTLARRINRPLVHVAQCQRYQFSHATPFLNQSIEFLLYPHTVQRLWCIKPGELCHSSRVDGIKHPRLGQHENEEDQHLAYCKLSSRPSTGQSWVTTSDSCSHTRRRTTILHATSFGILVSIQRVPNSYTSDVERNRTLFRPRCNTSRQTHDTQYVTHLVDLPKSAAGITR